MLPIHVRKMCINNLIRIHNSKSLELMNYYVGTAEATTDEKNDAVCNTFKENVGLTPYQKDYWEL